MALDGMGEVGVIWNDWLVSWGGVGVVSWGGVDVASLDETQLGVVSLGEVLLGEKWLDVCEAPWGRILAIRDICRDQ